MSNVKQITLANGVFDRLMQHGAQHEPATQLIASAAFQVGFARIAAGMARWSRETHGHSEIQARLSDEQFDVLMLAPVDAAARSAVSCVDLCAAAAYRLTGAAAQSKDQEADIQRLRESIKNRKVTLGSSQAAWLYALIGSAEWQLVMKVRTVVTHHAIKGLSVLGAGPAIEELPLFREINRSNRAGRPARSLFSARNRRLSARRPAFSARS
jgi:hypothetical protein